MPVSESPQPHHGASPTIDTIVVGALQANCYVLTCPSTHAAAVIDPGDNAERILSALSARGAQVTMILHTHGHFDHISATERLLSRLPAPVTLAAHPADAYLYALDAETLAMPAAFEYPIPETRALPTLALADGASVTIGTFALRVLHTPGHTPGSICLLYEPGFVLAGDTLFRRGIGRTDLAGGDEDVIERSIETRLYPLPPDLVVYPGHGDPTTIGEERRLNPFVRA